jgi:spermidine/putrescine transport system ATP-binding protein
VTPPRLLEIKNLSKSFGRHPVLNSISVDIESGEFVTILGESGSGKTTLLRLIAGFESPNSGEIHMLGKRIDPCAPFDRDINTVFQSYALFPHLNVERNVAYGLEVNRTEPDVIKERVSKALEMVKMSEFATAHPARLSGGQQQRVALARAIVKRPKILLLDEPLSALDANLRLQMQIELKALQKNLGITFILVTHDQSEAMALSDRIVLLNSGSIEQVATPWEIYQKPRTSYVAQFIGQSNLLQTTIENNYVSWQGHRWSWVDSARAPQACLRPERIHLSGVNAPPLGAVQFQAKILSRIFEGATDQVILELATGEQLKARIPTMTSKSESAEFWFKAGDVALVQTRPPQGH